VNNDTLQLLALAALAYYELCTVNGTNPVMVYIWDIIAFVTGMLANILGKISIQARLHYYEAVQI
jgi:hypothetical protein